MSDLFNKAQEHHLAGELDKAQSLYMEALKESPDNPDLYYALGIVALQRGHNRDAVEFLLTSISFDSENALYYKDAAIALQRAGDHDQAILLNSKSLKIDPENLDAQFNMGILYKEQSEFEKSIPYFEGILKYETSNCIVLLELADAYLQVKNYTEAECTAKRAIDHDPHNSSALYILAQSLYQQNKPQEAIALYEQLLRQDSENYNYNCGIVKCLLDAGSNRRAQHFAEKAASLQPDNIEIYSFLVEALIRNSELKKAISTNNYAINIEPENLKLITLKARLFELSGKNREAFELIKPQVVNQRTFNTQFIPIFIRHAEAFGFEKYADSLIQAIMKQNALTPRTLPVILFEAGHFYHRLKRYDEAFKFYTKANLSKPHTYDRAFIEQLFRTLKQTFNSQSVHQKGTETGHTPIFIIGMPRSGTSLVENILASHSQVRGAGELSKIQELVSALPIEEINPKADQANDRIKLSNERIDALADEYIEYTKNVVSSNEHYITDKMPQNFLYLGFIALLFPGAKIIHCRRNPIDTCFSCFVQNFASNGADFSYDLDDLGHYYNQYIDLMAYWKKTLSIPIYDIQYESLIGNPKSETRALIEFCKLDWEEACLEHQKSDHVTMTASYSQVRQPIYTSSKDRWKKYEHHLQPLIKAIHNYKVNPPV
jgi:tetratricopeptide (TPR) repeat protein